MAVRGSIVDVYPATADAPARIDLWGDEVERLTEFSVHDQRATIDLTEVSKQVRGGFNAAATTGYGCAQVAYKCLTSPTDYPINDGSFRSLKVIVPPGTFVSAVKPAAMRWWMTYPMTVIDTAIKAMLPAMPDKVAAAHHADLGVADLNGINPKDGRFFIKIGRAHV